MFQFRSKTKSIVPALAQLSTFTPIIKLEHMPELQKQMNLIGMTEEDFRRLKSFQPFIEDGIEEITAVFYEQVLAVPSLREIIEQRTTLERLKKLVGNYFISMFDGVFTEETVELKQRTARMHFKIGLAPKWYMGTFHHIQKVMFELIVRNVNDSNFREETMHTLSKFINLELQIVQEVHEQENIRLRNEQYNAVKSELKNNISLISEDVAGLTVETNHSLEKINDYTANLNQKIEENVEIVHHIYHNAKLGNADIKNLEQEMQHIETKTDELDELIAQLMRSSEEIINVVLMVKSIADQTNLLALNASIEAARAGEHGKGFAVVAQEVRKLSEQSKQSVESITSLAKTSTFLTSQAVTTIGEVKNQVLSGVDVSIATQSKFGQILLEIQQNEQHIKEIEMDIASLSQVIRTIGQDTRTVADKATYLYDTAMNL